nr:metallophosphoesterase [Kibdelosporangium sp. MJ126-NF4]CEL13090.1 metallophosphoesterase [Kibdelosporangium sp. MJ126-NF4]CTQ98777.1 metallophosphoesterase [Kibdelosporangium sp. MJ126-NF4]
MLSPIVFFAIIILLATTIHLYLWLRLVRSTTRPGRWRRTGTVTIAGLGLLGTVAFMVTRTVGVDAWWLAWPGYLWIATMFYLLLSLLVLEIPRAAVAVWRRRRRSVRAPAHARQVATVSVSPRDKPTTSTPSPSPDDATAPGPTDLNRRLFLARTCAATACVAAGGMVGYGLSSAFGDLTTTRVTVPLTGLDSRLSGFRIAVVSDTHFGPFLHRELADRIVTLINNEQPDMVAIIGDLADGSVAEVGHAAEPLRGLVSRHGTYFVTGNHDYSSGVDEWVDQVQELGMRPLLNEHVEISSQGAAFDLAGVNDLFARMYDKPGPDFTATLADRDPARPVILLAHQPVQVHAAIEHGVDLQLSGHTHGGQTAPFDRLVGLQQPVVAGLARKGNTSIFVTRGAGFFGPPVRAGIPPEVAIVQLQSRS